MKILLTGAVDESAMNALGCIDGRVYHPEDLPNVFNEMVSGILYSPSIFPADHWLDTEGRVGSTGVDSSEPGKLVKSVRRYMANISKTDRVVKDEWANNLPSNIAMHAVKPSQLPRMMKFGPVTFEDWTPFCFFANPILYMRNSVVRNDMLDEVVAKGGTVTKLPQRDVTVTKYAHDKWDELVRTGVESKMTYKGHPMKESGVAFLLPPRDFIAKDGRKNETGTDAIMFGTPLFKKFSYELAKRRMARVNDVENKADAAAHALMMMQDYTVWPHTVQEVYADSSYKMELTSVEDTALQKFSELMELYYQFIERNALRMVASHPEDFQMSMKPLKSPGTDMFMPDGQPYDKGLYYYYPNEHFDTGHPEANAYANFSYEPLKRALIPTIIPSVRERLRGLLAGKLHDPEWEFKMVMQGCSREGGVAWRINAPDKPSFKKIVKKDEIWEVIDDADKPIDYFPPYGSDEWSLCQGKPREMCVQTALDTFVTEFVSPVQMASLIADRQDSDYERAREKNSVQQFAFDKSGMQLRARIIMPHKWRFNMFDGTIAKLFAVPMEHCRMGFPSLKVGSGYEQFYRSQLAGGNSVPWAFDVSHFETFSSSNPEMMLRMFGSTERRRLFFEDAASGWLASAFGRRYHGFQTSSGIGCTTLFSLIPGMFLTGVDVAYRGDDTADLVKVAESVWNKLLYEACAWAIDRYSLDDINPFTDSGLPTYHTAGHEVTSLVSYGSDDQGGWDRSDSAPVSVIEAALTNSKVELWRTKSHSTAELGESSHFGIVRTSRGFHADPTGSDWKWCFSERKSCGDLIALGAVTAFSKTEGLEDDVQGALDAIKGGSTEAYWIGAAVATEVLRNNKEFAAQVIDAHYPKESPSGMRMSELLAESGINIESSNKLDLDTTNSIVASYLDFLKGVVHENDN